MKTKKTVFYKDELNDEFSEAQITPKKIDGSYKYERNGVIGAFLHFFWYRIVAIPLSKLYLKIKFAHKVEGKDKIRPFLGKSVFIYGNHTQATADALIPTFICFPKDAFLIVHPNNVSMPYLGRITPYLGAIPLPDDMAATRNFSETVRKRVENNGKIFIYPEAHIWPYCTKIRNFKDDSFSYPVKYKTPVFCFTNIYKKRKSGKGVKIVTYIDGPFFADGGLSAKEARKTLRDQVFSAMEERTELNEIQLIEYLPIGNDVNKRGE